MTAADLIKSIDEKACLDVLAAMVRHKSYTETPGERALVAQMCERMRAIGLDAEMTPVERDRVNAIGRWKGQGGGKSLLFNGHLDTNPVTEGWTVDPWGGLVDDKFIYGIGVSNMKAGDAASFCAVKTLIDAGVRLKGDVVLTYVVGELQGGIGSLAAIRQGVRADYFVNSEPTDLQALTMHAAAFTFVIELQGITRHLSKREEAVDAIVAACDLIPRLNAMTFSDAPSDEHRSINRVHVGVVHGALGRDLHEWRPSGRRHGAHQRVGALRSGSDRGQRNRRPPQGARCARGAFPWAESECRARESRWPTADAGVSSRSKGTHRQGRQCCIPDREGRAAAHRCVASSWILWDGRGHFYKELGMEGVVCGPGGRYNTMPDERVDIVDYIDMVRIYLLTILDICEVA